MAVAAETHDIAPVQKPPPAASSEMLEFLGEWSETDAADLLDADPSDASQKPERHWLRGRTKSVEPEDANP